MTSEKIYNQAFDRYYYPNHVIFDGSWKNESFPFGGRAYQRTINRINELMSLGNKVKCGYTGSAVKGSPHRYIFYKAIKDAE